jgi:hypothetical protein
MKCKRKGCKNELTPPLKGPVKYCKDPACELERKRKFGRAYYWRDGKSRRTERASGEPVKIIKEKLVTAPLKPKRHVSPDMSVDRYAPLRNCDRGTREGFKKYMDANPIYFAHVFPKMTVDEAWRSIKGFDIRG